MNAAARDAIMLEHLFSAQTKALIMCNRLNVVHHHFQMDVITQKYLNGIFEECCKMQSALDIVVAILKRR